MTLEREMNQFISTLQLTFDRVMEWFQAKYTC